MARDITITLSEEQMLLSMISNENRSRIYNGDLISISDIKPDKVSEFKAWLSTK